MIEPSSTKNPTDSPVLGAVERLDATDLQEAADLVSAEWGAEYRRLFTVEMGHLLGTPYTVLLGAKTAQGDVCGIAVINKSEMDFEYWAITWVVVAPRMRGQGLGKRLVEAAEAYVLHHKNDYPISRSRAIIQLTTTKPGFYEALGYKSVFDELMVKILDPEPIRV